MPNTSSNGAARPTGPWLDAAPWFALAVLVRAAVAARTQVPGRDAAHYLWMAERVAEGQIAGAFDTVFHPLYPLLVGALCWASPALDTVRAGQLVSCGCAALAILPLHALTRQLFDAHAARAASVLYACGIWFARHPADSLSEGPFYLLVVSTAAILLRAQTARATGAAGALAGLAYGVRPEAAALLLVGTPWLARYRGGWPAAMFAATFAATAAVWPIGWELLGPGFTLTPKLSFNLAIGVAGAEASRLHYVQHLLQLPGETAEALGYVAAPLAAWGAWSSLAAPNRNRAAATLLVGLFAVQIAVIPLLHSHFRFLSGYGILMLVLAGAAWTRSVRPRLLARPWWLAATAIVLALAGDLVRLPQTRRANRTVLVELGRWVAPQLSPQSRLVTEMPRLEFFAGQRPGPPRFTRATELWRGCKSPTARYAITVQPRTGMTDAGFRAIGFEPVVLPRGLADQASERGIVVYRRSDQ
ncbi:MAG: hypothetical protein AAF628_03310 [Planctomycetota bacterium]